MTEPASGTQLTGGSRLVRRGGAVCFIRFGSLTPVRQDHWSRAPARRGVWAFPYPMFDMFFAAHRFNDVLPKRLRTIDGGWPADPSGYDLPDELTGATVDQIRAAWDAGDTRIAVRPEFWTGREEWIGTHGVRAVGFRTFFHSGLLYTHLTRRGEVLDLASWQQMTATEYADAVARSAEAESVQHVRWRRRPDDAPSLCRVSRDHLEVFIPGKVRETGLRR